MPRSPSPADALFHQFLPLADSIARGFHHRGCRLIEFDDCRQVARMALWLACGRIEDPVSAPAYLSRCIRGALLHHARDLGRAIRVPRREQDKPESSYPWVLASLDQPAPCGDGTLLDRIAAEAPEPATEPARAALALKLLEQLPARQAAVLRLRYLQGLSCREASRELGIGHGSVSRDERQGLQRLRQALGLRA
ncbi:sigma-70 family RNA polymerase sigma factor [Synechococcus sp. CCAP 1479/9]|uniref:sigma-70 family RNA polymerase sigma factor n=1 Tax=Synechococcus sp. CCAP 1479/9 TaxID=1221593 RepID=UPI001C21682E